MGVTRHNLEEVEGKVRLFQESADDCRRYDGVLAAGKVALLQGTETGSDDLSWIERSDQSRDLVVRCPRIQRQVCPHCYKADDVGALLGKESRDISAPRIADEQEAGRRSPCRQSLVERVTHGGDDLGCKSVRRPIPWVAGSKGRGLKVLTGAAQVQHSMVSIPAGKLEPEGLAGSWVAGDLSSPKGLTIAFDIDVQGAGSRAQASMPGNQIESRGLIDGTEESGASSPLARTYAANREHRAADGQKMPPPRALPPGESQVTQ